jgi:two-component system cell cycle response regulator
MEVNADEYGFTVTGESPETIDLRDANAVDRMQPTTPFADPSHIEQYAYTMGYNYGRFVGATVVRRAQAQQEAAKLEEIAVSDSLTGLYNRRFLMDRYSELQRGRRSRNADPHLPHSLLALDADFFSRINNTYGHDTGDQVLVGIAKVLKEATRLDGDVAVRMGGEEFALLLPHTSIKAASDVAERIRVSTAESPAILQALQQAHLQSGQQAIEQVTLSIGVVRIHLYETLRMNYHRADQAMYAAKQAGRNQVVVDSVL